MKILLPRKNEKRWKNVMKILRIQEQKRGLWDISEDRNESCYRPKHRKIYTSYNEEGKLG